MSIIIRTEIEGILGNGTACKKSFITKRFPCDPLLVASVRTAELFRNEVYVYRKFLPLLGPFGPELIYADHEKIIMEDLSLEKFSIHDRLSLLDLEHCTAVIETMASFHAKSLSIKLKDPAYFQRLIEPMIEVVYPSDEKPSIGRSIEHSLNSAIQSLEAIPTLTREIVEAIHFLKAHVNNAYNIMRDLINSSGKHHVLTHGDVWINNILFSRNNKNLRVKLVDFQGARHASLATDFHYFVYSSSRTSVIEENYDDLVKLYHSSFLRALQELNVPEKDYQCLNVEWFNKELRKYALFGLFSALSLVHVILTNSSLKINTSEDISAHRSNIPITAEKTKRIECIVSHYIRTYM
ncbi:uncharacterized protein LOC117170280 isoform X2 [Belonocnema kinseyi]|nr:uncharacterized protein LOC117170280 isoform X2 [Belonocnema kinseyi]XP_033212840.1 uncharacterized protein LOC117170280 isoform X2 [Belonocnema kinseyi]